MWALGGGTPSPLLLLLAALAGLPPATPAAPPQVDRGPSVGGEEAVDVVLALQADDECWPALSEAGVPSSDGGCAVAAVQRAARVMLEGGAGLPLRGHAPTLAPRVGIEPLPGPPAPPLAGRWRRGTGLPLPGRALALAPRIGMEPPPGPPALPLADRRRPGRRPLAPRHALAATAPGAERAPSASSSAPPPDAPQRAGLPDARAWLEGLTPVGVIEALFSPPLLYVLIGLVVLCCSGGLVYVFRDGLEDYMMSVVDVLATIGRFCFTCLQSLYWCLQRLIFPLKECLMGSFRSTDHYYNPYKKKEPARPNVPTFQI